MGVPSQIEKLDALIHVRVVSRTVALDITFAAFLLIPPLRARAFVESFVDPPIELVDIHRVDVLL
ncbi:MAG TPA: hypothetical protein VNF99_15685 [Stellaceae bacterium]|nr:hypothetical protein [Stellaceae bacterium]